MGSRDKDRASMRNFSKKKMLKFRFVFGRGVIGVGELRVVRIHL